MIDIELKKRGVYLGKTGETGRYRVWMDVSQWADEYEGGTGMLLYTGPKGTTAPMQSVTEFDGEKTKIFGYVTEEETKEAGTGVIEARWMSAGVVAKSDHYNTVVMESSYTGKNIGDNTPDWVADLMVELSGASLFLEEAAQAAEDLKDIRESMEEAETESRASARDAEAWAVGKRNGQAVEEGDPVYANNSKHYAQQAGGSATAAVICQQNAEAWAVGKRGGSDVGTEDDTYHNNAKYWSDHAFSGTPQGYEAVVDKVDELKSAARTTEYLLEETPIGKTSTSAGTDLDVTDEEGNVLARFEGGGIKTKNFDSALTAEVRTTAAETDLDIADGRGNVVLRIKDGHIRTKNFTSMTRDDITTYVTVRKDGSGDYTTLRGAIDYIAAQGDADPVNHPYVIKIYPGTYNVLEDYTQEEIETADVDIYTDGFFGPYISDGMSLVGMGDRDAVILYGYLDPNDYVYRIRNNISTLNTQGNASLENLTVIAENLRYCVHDDFPYPAEKGQYKRIVKNCKFIGLNLHHDPSTTWGGGMSGAGENATFEDCDFGTDYGHHFNGTESVRIVFKNCKGRKLRLAERLVTVNHHVIIEDSQFEMISLMRPNYVTSQHIMVESNGCEKAYVLCSDDDVVITGAIVKTPLTNLPIGTLVRRSSASGNAYQSTGDLATADGVIVANDDYFSYVQRTGYINTRILGLTNFSVGDYVTIDASNKLVPGGTAGNAVGVVTFISRDSDSVDLGVGFIKMIVGGM